MAKTRALKFFLTTKNEVDDTVTQSSILSFISNGSDVVINDYGKIYTKYDVGEYSLSIISDQAILDFFPLDGKINDYSYSYVYYDTKQFVTDSSSFLLGDSVSVASTNASITSGISTTICKIPEKYSSSKLIIEISGDKNKYEFTEINLTSTSSDIIDTEYGRLNVNTNSLNGIGTYGAYRDGLNNININFYPYDPTENYTSNVVSVSLAKTEYTQTGDRQLRYADLSNSRISIASSTSPTSRVIGSHSLDYQSAYYLVQINDITNNRIQFSEILTTNNLTDSVFVEYGKLSSHGDLGEFDTTASGTFDLSFTPNPNINVEIVVFQQVFGFVQLSNYPTKIDLKNANIVTSVSRFGYGDENNNRTNFNLTHRNIPIFERIFNGSSSSNVNLQENYIYLPNHFFVTGEKVLYRSDEFDSVSTVNSIGIAQTYVSGIGNTNKLPSTSYVYKFDNARIGLCSSPEHAFSDPPILFDLTSLGIDSRHYITSTKQNAKSLICIDNVIQSPIVGISVTTTLSKDLNRVDDTLVFTGITSFFAGDLIKIDDEIMKVDAVGVGSTNYVNVKRPWMGTGISSHSSGSLVQKFKGNYNIIGNVLHFDGAPYGPFSPEPEFENSSSTSIETLINSTFQGRVFIRSGNPNISQETYEKNYLFDDVSNLFDAKQKTFELKQSSSSLTGFHEDNSIILVNNILQVPTKDFVLSEISSKTNLTFTGTATSISYDPNNANIPRGGIIVSVGSTAGLGYQPLVSAGGTAIVSVAGTIQSVSIGNSGSGYRKNLQLVRVGVQTSDTIGTNIQFIGTATVSNGTIIGVAITNPGVGYTAYPVIYETTTISPTAIGATQIFLKDISSVPTRDGLISVSSILTNVPIVGIGSTSVFVSPANAPASTITTNSSVQIKKYNPPKIIFDEPLSYSNIPLKYSGAAGFGTEATIDVVVGQGSSVIDFTIKNYGYSYSVGDVLTLPIDGVIGIPTQTSFREFKLTVVQTFVDSFSGWSIGNLRVLDDISDLINNRRRTFPISYQGNRFSIISKAGSNLDIQATLLVFVNDVLQEPGVGYIFNGGSTITFAEPLKVYPNGEKDKCRIIFYRGTDGVDVKDVDILETVKIGDYVKLNSQDYFYDQDTRLVEDILSVDAVNTNLYKGRGISENPELSRSINWTKQRNDIVIENKQITKDRTIYEPSIFPVTNITQNVGIGTTQIFVRSLKTFFDNKQENNTQLTRNSIEIISLDNLVSASATAIVNANGQVSSLSLINTGAGYSEAPSVYLQNPIGDGSVASYTANISNGRVTSFNSISVGSGYTNTNPPVVSISPPKIRKETINQVTYKGDFGIITGIATTSIPGVAQTGLVFDLLIEKDSPLRNSTYIDTPIQTSEIKKEYFFEIYGSNVGRGVTSIRNDNSILGIGTTGIDNIYQVVSVSIAQTNAYGIGLTNVAKVTTKVQSYSNISGLGFSNFYGNYSWGVIEFASNVRKNPLEFYTNRNYGVVGLNTTPMVRRISPLRYFNYFT